MSDGGCDSATAGEAPRLRPAASTLAALTLLVCGAALGTCSVRSYGAVVGPERLVTVTHAWVTWSCASFGTVCLVACCRTARSCRPDVRLLLRTLCAIAGYLAAAAALFCAVAGRGFERTEAAGFVENAREFVLLRERRSDWVLARVIDDRFLSSTYELVAHGGDLPALTPCTIDMLRPAPGGGWGESIVKAGDGNVLALVGPVCVFGFRPEDGRVYRGRALRDISPFALLAPADVGSADDLAHLRQGVIEVRRALERRGGVAAPASWEDGDVETIPAAPSERHLIEALLGPNAWARAAAASIADAGGEVMYPRALRLR